MPYAIRPNDAARTPAGPAPGRSVRDEIERLERAVARDRASLRPSALRDEARLSALLDAETRRGLLAAALPAGLGPDAACAERIERLHLAFRTRGPDGPVLSISARGRAFLESPAPPERPTWRLALARLPSWAGTHLSYAVADAAMAVAVAAMFLLWTAACWGDLALRELRLDAPRDAG
jgi:hypothetical protein